MRPGSSTPIQGSNNPLGHGRLLVYVSRFVISATEPFNISSGERMLNWIPIILETFAGFELFLNAMTCLDCLDICTVVRPSSLY